MMISLKYLYIQLYYCQSSQKISNDLISHYMDYFENAPLELFENLYQETHFESLLLSIIQKTDPSFNKDNLECEVLTAFFFLYFLYAYQDQKIQPIELLNIFSKIEAKFLSKLPIYPDKTIKYPGWLDLYDALDWCDETWDFNNSPHLLEAVQTQIEIIQQWLGKLPQYTYTRVIKDKISKYQHEANLLLISPKDKNVYPRTFQRK
ncbi:unnamed protein product [Commensalibacter communis]|uniref:hypothetical protein n=1 Tax=Commensalibacter communis TaxID=2972786 RepID=UPI0022FF50F0|nr:hypothetical protein [Commensalibacter communis]CAI3938734.1 unnamed protein product [Commensalibacter communis]